MTGRRVVVTGAGVISPLGDTPEALHRALCAGTGGLGPIEGFELDGVTAPPAGEVRGFDAAAYLGDGNLRPLDRTGRLAAAAAARALEASGWDAAARAEHEVGLVLGTMFGSVRTIAEFDRRAQTAGPIYAKPLDFANSVINAAAGQTAIWHRLKGVNTTLSGGPAVGLGAVAYAADLVRSGRAEAVLAGGADELCFELVVGFARAGRLAGTGPTDETGAAAAPRPVPFDAGRNGFAPAEGAALMMLEPAEAAAARGARVLAEIAGHGSAYDPSRGRDPRSAAAAVATAVGRALTAAGLEPGKIDALYASAHGGADYDRREAEGVAAALDGRAATLPVTAIKSMLGEALGASGALAAVALIQALGDGRLPGVAGLERLDPDLPLPGVGAASREVAIVRGLITALDLDGAVQALVIVAPPAGAGGAGGGGEGQ